MLQLVLLLLLVFVATVVVVALVATAAVGQNLIVRYLEMCFNGMGGENRQGLGNKTINRVKEI